MARRTRRCNERRPQNRKPFVRIVKVDKILPDARAQPEGGRRRIASTLRAGEFVSIVGPSGCGKSTLMMMVAGLVPVTAGEIVIETSRSQPPLHQSRHRVPARRAARMAHRDRQRAAADRHPPPRPRAAQPRRAICWRGSASPASRTIIRGSCPAACASASRSAAALITIRPAADGRAVRRARCDDARADESRSCTDLAGEPQDRAVHHAQHLGGGLPVRPDHRDEPATRPDRKRDQDRPAAAAPAVGARKQSRSVTISRTSASSSRLSAC